MGLSSQNIIQHINPGHLNWNEYSTAKINLAKISIECVSCILHNISVVQPVISVTRFLQTSTSV